MSQPSTCTICLSELNEQKKIGALECSHEFCFECIENWAGVVNTCPLCKARFRKIVLKSGTPKTRKQSGKIVRVANVEQQEVSYGPEDFAEEMYGDAQEYLEEEQALQEAIALNGIRFVGFGLANYDSEQDESFSGSAVSDLEDEDMLLGSSASSESSSSSSFEFPESSVSGTPFSAISHDTSFRPEESSSSSSGSESVPSTAKSRRSRTRYPLRTRRGASPPQRVPSAPAPTRRSGAPPTRRSAASAAPPTRRSAASAAPPTRRSAASAASAAPPPARRGAENQVNRSRPARSAKKIIDLVLEDDEDLFDDDFEDPPKRKIVDLVDDDDDDVPPSKAAPKRGKTKKEVSLSPPARRTRRSTRVSFGSPVVSAGESESSLFTPS